MSIDFTVVDDATPQSRVRELAKNPKLNLDVTNLTDLRQLDSWVGAEIFIRHGANGAQEAFTQSLPLKEQLALAANLTRRTGNEIEDELQMGKSTWAARLAYERRATAARIAKYGG